MEMHHVGESLLETENARRCFGDLLRRARQQAGLSQEALAQQVNVSRGVIANLENGIAGPEPARAVRLAELLSGDASSFLLLGSLQRSAVDKTLEGTELLGQTILALLERAAGVSSGLECIQGLRSHYSLLDFPDRFTPLTVIVGDKRETEPKNPGDLYVFSASTIDDRWLSRLGLPPDTEKLSDKVLFTADNEWLQERLGQTHILSIGSPASNLFSRDYNKNFLFRFAIGKEASHKWSQTRQELRKLRTAAELVSFREKSRHDLKQTMRLFKQPGFVNFIYKHLKLGIDPAENRDFAVVSVGRNPFAAEGEPFFAVLVAGVHHPGTAHALRWLSERESFLNHPFGGVLEIQVPRDDADRSKILWHNKIEECHADWHAVGDSRLKYTPAELRRELETRWLPKLKSGDVVTDVEIDAGEILGHISLIDALAKPED